MKINTHTFEINDKKFFIDSKLKLDLRFQDEEFLFFMYSRKELLEKDILEVFIDRARVGYLIPFNTLFPDDTINDNEHFLPMAYALYKEMLKLVFDEIKEEDGQFVEFNKWFDDSSCFLILTKSALEKNNIYFDVDKATATMISLGFVYRSQLDDNQTLYLDSPQDLPKKLNIKFISEEISNYQRLTNLLNNSFAYEVNPVFRFFIFYQIIESLMEEVYLHENDNVIDNIQANKGNLSAVRENITKINGLLKESERFKKLVTNYSSLNNNHFSVRDKCNGLLALLELDEKNEFYDYLYSLRNFIFHQFRNFPDENLKLLENIVLDLVTLLPYFLNEFKKPEITSQN